jgi:N-acyl-L-homoserine lactone synthetase
MELLEDRFLHRMADSALAAMFAARKRVFIDLLGWGLPARSAAWRD